MGLLFGPIGDIMASKIKNITRQGILGALEYIYRGQNNAIRAANEQREAERREYIKEMNKNKPQHKDSESQSESLRKLLNAKRMTPTESFILNEKDNKNEI